MPEITPTPRSHFKVDIADATIGYFSECSGLEVAYELYEYAEGGQNDFVHQLRGHKRYPKIVLRKGVTDQAELQKWFFQSKNRDQRGTLTISLLSTTLKPVRNWAFSAAFPVSWTGPSLNAGSSDAADERLEVAHEGMVL